MALSQVRRRWRITTRNFTKYIKTYGSRRKKKQSVFGCDQCGVAVGDEHKLKNHEQSQHPVSSPEPSPPRKKPVIQVQVEEEKEEIMDTEEVGKIEENYLKKETYKDELIKTQAKQLEEQSKEISEMKKK